MTRLRDWLIQRGTKRRRFQKDSKTDWHRRRRLRVLHNAVKLAVHDQALLKKTIYLIAYKYTLSLFPKVGPDVSQRYARI